MLTVTCGHVACLHPGTGMDSDIKDHPLVMQSVSPEPPVATVGHQCTILEVLQFGHDPEYILEECCVEVNVPLVASGHLDNVMIACGLLYREKSRVVVSLGVHHDILCHEFSFSDIVSLLLRHTN